MTTPALEAMARALASSFARDGEPDLRASYVDKHWPKWVDDAKAAVGSLAAPNDDLLTAILQAMERAELTNITIGAAMEVRRAIIDHITGGAQ